MGAVSGSRVKRRPRALSREQPLIGRGDARFLNIFRKRVAVALRGALKDEVLLLHEIVATNAIDLTPVKTGHAKRNWQTTTDLASSLAELDGVDPQGEMTLRRNLRAARGFRPGQTLRFVGTTPYHRRLEDGSSQQAPIGMLGPAQAMALAIAGVTR